MEADRHYYSLDNKNLWVEKKGHTYNPFGKDTLNAFDITIEGKEVLNTKFEYKFDERNNNTLEAVYIGTEEGKEVLFSKTESKYDERNNETFIAAYMGEDETLKEKNTNEYRSNSYAAVITQYEPEIKQIQEKLEKTKDESEKKSLNQKLEDLQKAFESKKKKYTLTEEKFGANEKLESASYKLLFFNPRGPAEKRLMRVDLDRFYRPVKVGFEEE